MDYYVPLMSKVVDSSLWLEPDYVVKIFLTMLVLKDQDHVVRMTAFAIAQRSHKTEAEVLQALKVLEAPDTKRLEEQAFEGRRVERVFRSEDGSEPGGWRILNGEFYKNMMRVINRRAYNAQKEREARADGRRPRRSRGTPLAGESAAVRALENGHGEEHAERIQEATMPAGAQVCSTCGAYFSQGCPECERRSPAKPV